MGGLLLALRLTQRAMPVTVIEKNAQFGGVNGRLSTGNPMICYSVLGLEDGSTARRLLEGLRIPSGCCPRRRAEFERVIIGCREFRLPGTLPGFEEYLREHFAKEGNAIGEFCGKIRDVYQLINDSTYSTSLRTRVKAVGSIEGMCQDSYRGYLDTLFGDDTLKQIVSSRAFSSRNSVLTMLAYLGKSLIDGLYYLPYSGCVITEALVDALRRSPYCRLIDGVAVKELIFDARGRTRAVRLEHDEVVAGSVVLDVDPRHVCGELIRDEGICKRLNSILANMSPSLSAIVIIFSFNGAVVKKLRALLDCARVFCSDGTDAFEVLQCREMDRLDLRNCKMNFDFAGGTGRAYVEFDCSGQAMEMRGDAVDVESKVRSVIAGARNWLARIDPDFEDGVVDIEVVTPRDLGIWTNSCGGAASGFPDQPIASLELSGFFEEMGLLQVGQWSPHGTGFSQLEAGALHAYRKLRRGWLPLTSRIGDPPGFAGDAVKV